MSRRKLLSADYVQQVLQTRTQKQAAEFLGIGERTLRRIKNIPGYQPRETTIKRVAHAGERERARVSRVRVTQKLRGRGSFRVPKLRVIPPVKRQTRLDPRDKRLKRRMWSDTLAFDVRKLRGADLLELLQYYRDRGVPVNIIYRVPEGGRSLGGRTYPDGGRAGTGWESLEGWSDQELLDWIADIQKAGPLSLIQVQD